MMNEVRLEKLVGRVVTGPDGKAVGRIEEMLAEKRGDEWVITEFWIGPMAYLERLSVHNIGLGVLRLMGARHGYGNIRAPWDALDLSDPDHPKLSCDPSECAEIPENARGRNWFEQGGINTR